MTSPVNVHLHDPRWHFLLLLLLSFSRAALYLDMESNYFMTDVESSVESQKSNVAMYAFAGYGPPFPCPLPEYVQQLDSGFWTSLYDRDFAPSSGLLDMTDLGYTSQALLDSQFSYLDSPHTIALSTGVEQVAPTPCIAFPQIAEIPEHVAWNTSMTSDHHDGGHESVLPDPESASSQSEDNYFSDSEASGPNVDAMMKAIQSKGSMGTPGSPANSTHNHNLIVSASTPTASIPSALSRECQESEGIPVRREYRCEVPHCGKVFTQKARLRVHTRTHDGYKPYVSYNQLCVSPA